MIRKNRFKKYLLYAIGEVLLVVIGILIALQLNNYNDYKKERQEEYRLLKKFERDFEKDSLDLVRCYDREAFVQKSIDSLFDYLKKGDDTQIMSFLKMSERLGFFTEFAINSGTFDEAVSSGKMDVIENDSLRETLFNYYLLARSNKNQTISKKFQLYDIVPAYSDLVLSSNQAVTFLGYTPNPLPELTFEIIKNDKNFNKALIWRKANTSYQLESWDSILNYLSNMKTQLRKEIELRTND